MILERSRDFAMTVRGFRQLALLLVLTGVFATRADAHALCRAQGSGVLPPARAGLAPVHQPDLKDLEPSVRDQLISFQNSLAAVIKDSAITAPKLGEAYGQLGKLYQAYSLLSPAKECYLNARQLAPKDFRWTYLLAKISQQEGRTEEA